LVKAQYRQAASAKVKCPWTMNRHLKIKKTKGRDQREVGGHKERVREGKYDGCISYSFMKIEKRNLLKLL
jgi:hypothetical protein